ncbi:hypothetical protein [Actinoplanes sp. NBRC 103695]|uniref:hypothetical protein n=1 Tax=Actinoplanes sp. NBRC 103695 TaxID=3032202 RepID=UPI0024A4DB04|nr:hypothetical protein [Actinoplanes sp. NBRC 103695]GLY95546.1 hypothetical protein Acsp02_28010 [Actinoplanes sp. NBRC 103695]
MTELLVLRGVVEASPDAVTDLLLDVRPGGRSPLAATGDAEPPDGDEFTVTKDGSRITVAVDRQERSVSQQGEWWYRGVTTVEPDPRGARVIHRIYNVAPGRRWAVRFVSRGPLNAAPVAFAAQLTEIGRALNANAWVEET